MPVLCSSASPEQPLLGYWSEPPDEREGRLQLSSRYVKEFFFFLKQLVQRGLLQCYSQQQKKKKKKSERAEMPLNKPVDWRGDV